MKSNFFKRLAALPGINWFNHKAKMEYLAEEPIIPTLTREEKFIEALQKAERYLSHIQALEAYIKTMLTLIDEFDDEVIRWDRVQAQHEREIREANEGNVKKLKNQLQDRDIKITKLENRVRDLEQHKSRPIISDEAVTKLIAHLERVDVPASSKEKYSNKYRQMHQTLHNFLQKLQAHSPKELIDGMP